MLDGEPMSVAADEPTRGDATVDLVWVDEVDGDLVWAVNPWGDQRHRQERCRHFAVGEDGTMIDQGDVDDVDDADGRRRRGR